MTCPKCNSEDTAIVSTYTRKWTCILYRGRRSGEGEVARLIANEGAADCEGEG